MQTAIVLLIVLAAAVYAVRRLRKPECGCSGCGCDSGGQGESCACTQQTNQTRGRHAQRRIIQ